MITRQNAVEEINKLVDKIDECCSNKMTTCYKIASAHYMRYIFAVVVYNMSSNAVLTENELIEQTYKVRTCNLNPKDAPSPRLISFLHEYKAKYEQSSISMEGIVIVATTKKLADYQEILKNKENKNEKN